MTEARKNQASGRLLAEVICPNCWERFPPEQMLFIARHESMIGDEIAGRDAFRRFLPSRFTPSGDAIDPAGETCQRLACPNCHLEVARPLIEMPPHFISIAGAPGSGKSYFLAAMTWELRRLATNFGLALADGDSGSNAYLQECERVLFMADNPDQPVALRKTDLTGGELYQTAWRQGAAHLYPRPFVFVVSPTPGRAAEVPYRAMVLYDNAGEHFLPGQDQASTPVTLHLAQSQSIVFLFDPTQDPRFRKHCHIDDPQVAGLAGAGGASRQESILHELGNRIRLYRGVSHTERHQEPLILALAKADTWLPHDELSIEPWTDTSPRRLDFDRIDQVSHYCRGVLSSTCPEIVSAADAISEKVLYVPVSSLGCSPELVPDPEGQYLGIRPTNMQPRWVTVPLLWSLSRVPGLIS